MSSHSNEKATLFTKIITREIPADILFENERIIAFRDIAPQAPVHVLIVPKKPIKNMQDAVSQEDTSLIGEIMFIGQQIARQLEIEKNFRIVTNSGEKAGQTIFHLHFHLLGGSLLGPIC